MNRSQLDLAGAGLDPQAMPLLRPWPIPTKYVRPWWKSLWNWIHIKRHWVLEEDWTYEYKVCDRYVVHRFQIPKGFIFDGASVPRPFWTFLSPTGVLLIPALLHDYAYCNNFLWDVQPDGVKVPYRKGAGKIFWDGLFRRVAIQVNGFQLIFGIVWLVLVIFGWIAWWWLQRQGRHAALPASGTIDASRDASNG